MTAKLPARRIGYLRNVPAANGQGAVLAGPRLAMVRKLAAEGYAVFENERWRRTPAGDDAVALFDDTLSKAAADVLTRLCTGATVRPGEPGVQTLLYADLIFVSMRGSGIYANENGRALHGRRTAAKR